MITVENNGTITINWDKNTMKMKIKSMMICLEHNKEDILDEYKNTKSNIDILEFYKNIINEILKTNIAKFDIDKIYIKEISLNDNFRFWAFYDDKYKIIKQRRLKLEKLKELNDK